MALFKVKAVPDFTQLRNELTKLSSTPVKIKVDATEFQALSNQAIKTMNATARLTKAQNELAVAQEKTKQTANQLAAAQQKTTQTTNQLATQMERTATAEEKARKANLDLSREIQKATTEQEKQKTVAAQTALQQEKTATSAANLAVQQEKTATSAVKAAGSIKEVGQEAKNTSAFAGLMGDTFTRTIAKMAVWQVLGDVISKTVSAFKDAISTMKDVDTEMVNVQKVTDYSKAQMKELEENAYALASAYGRAADEITSMYTTFARAGYIGDQLDSMTELGTLLSNIGDVSEDTAAKFLLAVDAAWKLGGSEKDLMTIMDGLNEITNKNAVDMEALTSGITVAGSVFSEAGESVQTFSSLVGAGVAATQRSGSEISRALRTIVMNIRQIRGETEDGELIDGESVANASKSLKEYAGINTMVNGQLRLSSDVLKDLASKWESLDTVAQSAISEALAGKRQANVLSALMGNWETVEKMMTDYADGVGSALRENEIYMDSWEAKSKKLSAAWTEFVSHLIETDAIKGALDGVIGLVELLDSDVGHFIITVGALTTAVILLGQAKKALAGTEVVSWITQAIPKIKELTTAVNAYAAAKKAAASGNRAAESALTFLKPEVDGAAKSLGSLASKFGIVAGFAVAFYAAIKAGTAKFDAYNEAVENTAEAQSKLSDYKTELADLESRTGTLTDAERRRLEVLREITAEQEKQVKAAKQTEYETYSEAYGSGAAVATGTTGTGSGGIGGWGSVETIQRDVYQLTEYQRQLNDLQEQYANQTKDSAMSTGEYYTALQTLNDGYAETVEKLRDFILAGIEVTDNERELVMAYDEAQVALGNVGQSVQIVTDAYNQLVSSGEISKSTWETLIAYYPQLADAATQTADGYEIQRSALENLMSAEQRQQTETQNTVNKLIEEERQSGATGKALYDLVAAQITASSTGLDVSQQIAALQALAVQAGYTAQAIAQVFAYANGAGTYQADSDEIKQRAQELMESGAASSVSQAFNLAKKQLTEEAWGNLTSNYTPSISVPSVSYPSGGGYSGGGYSGGGSSSRGDGGRQNAQAQIKKLQKERDAELAVIQKQIDALKEQTEEEDRQAKLEEYKLEILKKQDAVMNARNERTVRQYNASTGQWEWVADATKVKKAEEDLENAKKELREYERKVEIDLAVDELKARQDAIKAAYQIKIDAWQDYLDGLSSAISAEKSMLDQSVANNQAATNAIIKAWNEANKAKENGNESGDVQSPGGGDDTVYAPDNASTTDIKIMQAYLGVTPDGIWGKNSEAALKKSRFSSFDEMLRHFYADGGALDQAVAKVRSDKVAKSTYDEAMRNGYSSTQSYAVVARSYKYDEGGILKGMGGIKATPKDEIVLPPKLAAKMLTPLADRTFKARLGELGYLYGAETGLPRTLTGSTDNRNYTDNSGTRYQIGSIVMTEQQAKQTTIYEAAQQAHNLQAFNA